MIRKEIWRGIWELWMPRSCLRCGGRLRGEEHYLCAQCLSKAPLDIRNTVKMEAMALRLDEAVPLVDARALYRYGKDPEARRLLFELKYHGKPEVGYWMGQLLARRLEDTPFFQDVDYLVPVPLHPRKYRKRGYNQAEWLARGVASLTGIPLRTDAVRRTVYTTTQTRLDIARRKKNMTEAFGPHRVDDLAGKHLLLIDDVLTTGATLSACIKALLGVKDLRVSVLTLAYVDHRI